MPLKSQPHQGTCLFRSAASQRGCPKSMVSSGSISKSSEETEETEMGVNLTERKSIIPRIKALLQMLPLKWQKKLVIGQLKDETAGSRCMASLAYHQCKHGCHILLVGKTFLIHSAPPYIIGQLSEDTPRLAHLPVEAVGFFAASKSRFNLVPLARTSSWQ